MEKKFLGGFIIGSSIIWGAVIIATSFSLRGFEGKINVISTLSLGAALHLILIWGPIAAKLKKSREEEK